jgi:hypothetical protein
VTLETETEVLRPAGVALPLAGRLRPWLWLVGWWAVGRLVTIVTAFALHASIWQLGIWDGRWYRMVARYGYLVVPGRQSDPAFFPLYAILLRATHAIGIDYEFGGPLLANLGLLATLAVFYLLTRELGGEELARRATIYVAIFPFGYVFSMTYPESIVLGLIAGAGLAALRGRWLLAGLLGAAASLGRPEGVFVALPLLGIAWGRRRELTPARRGLALGAVLAPLAGLLSYPAYLGHVIHNPHAWQDAQEGWSRHFHLLGFVGAVERLPQVIGADHWLLRDVIAAAVYLVLLAVAVRAGLPLMWALAGAIVVVLPPFSGAFDSISRFGLLVPPIFWGLAVLGRRRRVDLALRGLSLALLVGAVLSLPYVFP